MDIKGFLSSLSQIDFLLYIAILFLIILVVSLLYILKNSDTYEEEETENLEISNNEFDINEAAAILEKEIPDIAKYTPYEEEQEEKAIISYDELVAQNQKKHQYAEKVIDNEELSIKKIDLTKKVTMPDMPKTNEPVPNKLAPNLLKYNKEEEFLKTLKAFSKLLD